VLTTRPHSELVFMKTSSWEKQFDRATWVL